MDISHVTSSPFNVLSDNTIRCINTDLITSIKRAIIQSHIYSVIMILRSQPVTQSSSCQILLSNHDISGHSFLRYRKTISKILKTIINLLIIALKDKKQRKKKKCKIITSSFQIYCMVALSAVQLSALTRIDNAIFFIL